LAEPIADEDQWAACPASWWTTLQPTRLSGNGRIRIAGPGEASDNCSHQTIEPSAGETSTTPFRRATLLARTTDIIARRGENRHG
jgi:hypothetical protein